MATIASGAPTFSNLKVKIGLGLLSIAVCAAAAIGGTFAYFSAATNSTGNTFTNGTIVIAPGDTYIEKFNISRFKPGDVLDATTTNSSPAITLNNQGTLPFDLYLKLNASSIAGTANQIEVQELKFGSVNLISGLTPSGSFLSLSDVVSQLSSSSSNITLNGNDIGNHGVLIGSLPQAVSGSWDHIRTLQYKLKFVDSSSEQNALQGDITTIDFEFFALQQAGTVYSAGNNNITNGLGGSGGGTWTNP